MIQATDVQKKSIVQWKDQYWTVLEKSVSGSGHAGQNVFLKLKNLDTSEVVENNFKSDEPFEEPESKKLKLEYSYKDGDSYVFIDQENYEQHPVSEEVIGEQKVFLKENEIIDGLFVEDTLKSIEFPETVQLKVTSSPEGVKDTDKEVTLENDLTVLVPHFVQEGESVIIRTDDFSYVERVSTKHFENNAVSGTGKHDEDDDEDKDKKKG